ncbi:MAG: MFS transporter [Pseudomonadota bacterium]
MSTATTQRAAPAMPWALVAVCCVGMFAATASGSVRSPFLLDMSVDFEVSLPAVANLFGVTSVFWGVAAYIAGRASDRIGRDVFLVFSPLMLMVMMAAMAVAQGYWLLVMWTAFGGMCCGCFTATSMAEVSLRTGDSHRGRALGYVMSGQSLTLLIGVPLAAWLGGQVGWRGVFLGLAGLSLAAGICTAAVVLRQPALASESRAGGEARPLRSVLDGPISRLFAALILERVCFGLAAFYYPAFLRTAYELSIEDVAVPLLGFAVGNIVGTILGGQLADRFPYRRVSFAVMMVITAACAAVLFLWRPGLELTMVAATVFSFFNAMARPPLLAAMANVPPDVRGVVMGLNTSVASVGWLTAALVGGWVYASIGFASFGPIMAAMCIFAALVVLPDTRLFRRQRATT